MRERRPLISQESIVRRARLDDADAIAAVHLQAWHETYTGMLPQLVIDARTLIDRRREETRTWLADADSCAHVALIEGELVGFASGGTSREPVVGFDGELHRIYLLQRAQRRGLGEMLVRAVADDLRGRGLRSMAVLVLAENARARAFYENRDRVRPDRRRDLRLGQPGRSPDHTTPSTSTWLELDRFCGWPPSMFHVDFVRVFSDDDKAESIVKVLGGIDPCRAELQAPARLVRLPDEFPDKARPEPPPLLPRRKVE